MKEQAINKCEKTGQKQLLQFAEQLNSVEEQELYEQIMETDFSVIENSVKGSQERGTISPIEAMKLDEINREKENFRQVGIEAIQKGQVAAVLLAGGMGTRLGCDGPKGTFSMGETRELTIFQCLINNLLEVVQEAKAHIHLFVMTSDKNHETTLNYFQEHDYLGYPKEYLHFFRQEMAPATDREGKIFMEAKHKLATSPNGNGGWYSSLLHAGYKELFLSEGIKWLNVFAVDNVLQRIADPSFVGATIQAGKSSGAKVIRKNAPDEKVGVMCLEDGQPSIVEYYEITEEMKTAKNNKGELAYEFGVILNYLFQVEILNQISDASMPLHVVEKKIPFINEKGEFFSPTEVNGFKYETLILDMIHLCPDVLVYEVEREKEFAPVKNATGIDSVVSARELLKKNGISL